MTRTEALAIAAEMVQECEDLLSGPMPTSLYFPAVEKHDVVRLRDALLALMSGDSHDPS